MPEDPKLICKQLNAIRYHLDQTHQVLSSKFYTAGTTDTPNPNLSEHRAITSPGFRDLMSNLPAQDRAETCLELSYALASLSYLHVQLSPSVVTSRIMTGEGDVMEVTEVERVKHELDRVRAYSRKLKRVLNQPQHRGSSTTNLNRGDAGGVGVVGDERSVRVDPEGAARVIRHALASTSTSTTSSPTKRGRETDDADVDAFLESTLTSNS